MRLRWVALFATVLLSVSTLRAQNAPELRIVGLQDGATVDAPVTVRVEHSGIVFDGVKIGSAPEQGVGHWHVNVDGQYAGLSVSNVLEIPNDALPTITAGEHTITVDLHENNHAATDPPVSQSIKLNFAKDVSLITPKTGSPTISLVDPGVGADGSAPIVVRIEHSGIIFDGVKIGSAPEQGVGHWHVNVDGQYAGLSVSNVIEIPNDAFPTIPAGQHTITVDLHENNHAATDPPVSQSIKLNFAKDVSLITPKTGSPTISLVDPGVGADGSAPIVVRIEHSGIIFDGVKIGSAPEQGVGHWHVNVDGQYAGLSVSNVIEIPNDAFPTIPAGQHTITVDLHENNHAATDPPVSESFEINLSTPLALSGGTSGAPAATTTGDAMAGHSTGPLPNTGMTGGSSILRILTFVLVAASLLQLGLIFHLLRYDGFFRRSRRNR